jgi:uncharacterized lipoprotein YbaY
MLGLIATSAIAQDRFNTSDFRQRTGADLWSSNNNWFGGTNNTQQWSLGVRGDSTETGFVISQVTPNGAAARARLQPGDVVVAVEGFQVGQVSGRLYDLNTEINRRADTSGGVNVLLQDGQNGRLYSLRLALDGASHQVAGTVSSPYPLPSDAMMTVTIDNVSRPNYPMRNGQQVYNVGNQQNVRFQMAYDPQFMFAQDSYQVRVVVSSSGREILYARPVPISPQGNNSQLQLRLEGVPTQLGPGSQAVGYVNYNQLDDSVIQMYQRYLGRTPGPAELAAARLLGMNVVDRLPQKLMASQEYFDLARNDNDYWLQNVFSVIVGRQPSAEELGRWRQRYADLRFSRTELLRQLTDQIR